MRGYPVQDLIKALVKAKAEFAAIEKNAKAYNYKYATLAEVAGAITPALCNHGLVVTQPLEQTEAGLLVRTQLWHESGQCLESTMLLPECKKIQDLGSAITYARRYALSALFGVAPSDDDGAEAQEKTEYKSNGNGYSTKKSYSTTKPAAPPPPKPPTPQAMTPQELNKAKADLGVAPEVKVPAVTAPSNGKATQDELPF
jgi:hypothetical protein